MARNIAPGIRRRFSFERSFGRRQLGGIDGVESLGTGGFEQRGRSGDEGDARAGKHVARRQRGPQLQGLRPAQRSAIEKHSGRLNHTRIQRLLHHARGFNPQQLERGNSGFSCNLPGALTAADGRVNLEWSGSRDQLAVVLHGLHQPDERVGTRLAHKQLGEGCRLQKKEAHSIPRSSSMVTATGSPCTSTGWKRCASSGMPASARLSRMVVVG